jgi:hypothetical protein
MRSGLIEAERVTAIARNVMAFAASAVFIVCLIVRTTAPPEPDLLTGAYPSPALDVMPWSVMPDRASSASGGSNDIPWCGPGIPHGSSCRLGGPGWGYSTDAAPITWVTGASPIDTRSPK